MKAKRKPLETLSLEELGVERAGGIEAQSYEPPPQRGGGKMVESVDELVSELKSKGLL
jgi:electron transfer flavoprotein beta subunit